MVNTLQIELQEQIQVDDSLVEGVTIGTVPSELDVMTDEEEVIGGKIINIANITINPRKMTNVYVDLSKKVVYYNGKVQENSYRLYTYMYGTKLVKNTDYTVAFKNNIYPGTASITFTGKGYFTGSVTKTFTIMPNNLNAPSKISVKLYGHDDVHISWNKSSKACAYDVYYKSSKMSTYNKLGRTTKLYYKKSNLSDGLKHTFRIVPCVKINGKVYACDTYRDSSSIYTLKKISTPKVTKSSKNKVKVSWTNIGGETGYQISKSTKKGGTSIVSTYKTTSGKSKVIKATRKKTYYYKVRAYKTVDGKKIYGPWSSVKKYKLK